MVIQKVSLYHKKNKVLLNSCNKENTENWKKSKKGNKLKVKNIYKVNMGINRQVLLNGNINCGNVREFNRCIQLRKKRSLAIKKRRGKRGRN